jgi:hypothetical protein
MEEAIGRTIAHARPLDPRKGRVAGLLPAGMSEVRQRTPSRHPDAERQRPDHQDQQHGQVTVYRPE